MDIASLNLSAAAVPSGSLQSQGVETVGFGRRAAARIIDIILHLGVAVAAGIFTGLVLVIAAAISGNSADPLLAKMGENSVASRLLSLFGFILYCSICEGLYGSTAGKYLLGLVVLREEDGGPCTYVQAVGRSFAFVIDGLFAGLIAFLSMKDSPRDQRFGDKWSGTVVARRTSAPAGVLRKPIRFVGVLFLALFVDSLALMAAMLS